MQSSELSNKSFMFTIDTSYNIKAVLNTLPHVVYCCIKTSYQPNLIRKDFEKWRSGDYTMHAANDNLIINESNRVYIFMPHNNITQSELLWLLFDELKLTNQKINQLQNNQLQNNKLPCEINKLSLVTLDYKISTLNINLNELNVFLSNICNYVIGVRGYWLNNSFITFNITQVLCADDRKFEPFVDLKLVNTRSTIPDENAYITIHDLLGSFSNLSIRLYCKENNIMKNDCNNFISKSANAYFEGTETSMQKELTKKFFEASDFSLEKLEYKTSIIIDTSDQKCFSKLNEIMKVRNMQIIEGFGHWINPIIFTITKLVFKSLDDEDDFEKIESIGNKSEHQNKNSLKFIKTIEKFYRKDSKIPNQIVFVSDNTSGIQYNLHLLVTFE